MKFLQIFSFRLKEKKLTFTESNEIIFTCDGVALIIKHAQ